MTNTFPARRLPLIEGRTVPPLQDFKPGDYCGPTTAYTAGKPAVMYMLPGAGDPDVEGSELWGFGHVTMPPHTFRECPDGSLEIRASIAHKHYKFSWHGFLDEGNVWRLA